MEFNFPEKQGTGITKLIPHVSADAQDLIMRMLEYNPDDRITATQALKHAYFKEMREADGKNSPTQT
jgi:renal tumor antigen